MVRVDVLADTLKSIVNAERAGKRQVMIRPASKVTIKVLQIMQKNGYIGNFTVVDDHRVGKIVIDLNGRINKCGVISPRYNAKADDMEKWVTKLLPSRLFGLVIVTTSSGMMTHSEAMQRHLGGKIVAFCF